MKSHFNTGSYRLPGAARPAAQSGRCSERHSRDRGTPGPSSRPGERDQLSRSAPPMDLLNVWFAFMQTKSKLYTFELVALSSVMPRSQRKKTVGSSEMSTAPFPSVSACTAFRFKNKRHLFINARGQGVCRSQSLPGQGHQALGHVASGPQTHSPPVWLAGW